MDMPDEETWFKQYQSDPKEMLKFLKSNECFQKRMIDFCADKTMQSLNKAKQLLEKCNFDIRSRVEVTIRRVFDDAENQLLVWAETQSGKSAYKAVEMACYLTMGIFVVLCTKGKTESQALAKKIKNYFRDSSFQELVYDIYHLDAGKPALSASDGRNAFALVIPDTHTQIRRATDLLKETKCFCKSIGERFSLVMILDECDAIEHRSLDGSQENEKAMARLGSLGVKIETKVTATPMPVISWSVSEQSGRSFKVATIPPQRDYVGIECLQPYESNVFLDSDTVKEGIDVKPHRGHDSNKKQRGMFCKDKQTNAIKFPLPHHGSRIPAWNIQCNSLVHSAYEDIAKGAKGVLVLVGTCTGVETNENIFQQGAWVQDSFRSKGKRFVAIVVHAGNVYYRLPGDRYGYSSSKDVGDLINAIDRNKKFGLSMPIVIFGYHSLKRSISYRSDNRVPTHLIMYHRSGQSIENVRQAAGRATYIGAEVLKQNMKRNYVPTLMIEEDYQLVQKHDGIVRNAIELIEAGKPPEQVMAVIEPFLDSTKRKSGVYDFRKVEEEQAGRKRQAGADRSSHQSKRAMIGDAGDIEDASPGSAVQSNNIDAAAKVVQEGSDALTSEGSACHETSGIKMCVATADADC